MITDLLLLIIALILFSILILLLINSRQLALFNGKKDVKPKVSGGSDLKSKYVKAGLSEAIADDFKDKIEKAMHSEQLYLDPNFKLQQLADEIGLSRHQTSLVLNDKFEMDFNSYVNSLRINEAKKIFSKGKREQIADVMYKVGFNNSTTFNRAFKKVTGLTPTSYLLSRS